MAPSCVVVWQLASQYGVVWAMCMCSVLMGLPLCAPSFVSVSIILFHVILLWA